MWLSELLAFTHPSCGYMDDAPIRSRSIFSGVAYLHEHDIVHRDLKFVRFFRIGLELILWMCRPQNILFRTKDEKSDIVIVDFGM